MARKPRTELTSREVEVLRLTALGYTSAAVASQLGISPRTVETHRAHIHRKLGTTSRAELVGHALRRGLLVSGQATPERPATTA